MPKIVQCNVPFSEKNPKFAFFAIWTMDFIRPVSWDEETILPGPIKRKNGLNKSKKG